MYQINIPQSAKKILNILSDSGYDTYVVGGCVRDSLLGLNPKDWDICTAAVPEQTIKLAIRNGYRVIETGLKHGTVTVVINSEQYEVTTFRIDGNYSDGRHPDSVEFTKDVRADLARRDFTINAMAFSNNVGIIDPFAGRLDLDNGILRCVGNPDDRFNEDALRILRALRLASVYELSIDRSTAESIHRNAASLNRIAVERINAELCKMLIGTNAIQMLTEFSDVITTIIPELQPCIGFHQNNRYHDLEVYDHIILAVGNYCGDDLVVKLALLLHDIGKPDCYTENEAGGHFYGHGVVSHNYTVQIMCRLRFDNKTASAIEELVLYHDAVIEPTKKCICRWLRRIGEKQFRRLLDVQLADIKAHSKITQNDRMLKNKQIRELLSTVLAEEACFKIKDLKINGNDIIALGIPQGRKIGSILDSLLSKVVDGELENDPYTLKAAAFDLVSKV